MRIENAPMGHKSVKNKFMRVALKAGAHGEREVVARDGLGCALPRAGTRLI
jgi:hypothetical protein